MNQQRSLNPATHVFKSAYEWPLSSNLQNMINSTSSQPISQLSQNRNSNSKENKSMIVNQNINSNFKSSFYGNGPSLYTTNTKSMILKQFPREPNNHRNECQRQQSIKQNNPHINKNNSSSSVILHQRNNCMPPRPQQRSLQQNRCNSITYNHSKKTIVQTSLQPSPVKPLNSCLSSQFLTANDMKQLQSERSNKIHSSRHSRNISSDCMNKNYNQNQANYQDNVRANDRNKGIHCNDATLNKIDDGDKRQNNIIENRKQSAFSNQYCNPIIVKRQKSQVSKGSTGQQSKVNQNKAQQVMKIRTNEQSQCSESIPLVKLQQASIEKRQNISLNAESPQFLELKDKIAMLQKAISLNKSTLSLHSSQISKIQEYQVNSSNLKRNNSQFLASLSTPTNLKKSEKQQKIIASTHSRTKSISNLTGKSSPSNNNNASSSPRDNSSFGLNFKELNDIMSLVQQTKNYQIKNSQQYRKMIEEFRSTILDFKDEINKSVKKEDLSYQILKIKEDIGKVKKLHKTNVVHNSSTEEDSIFSKKVQKQVGLLKQSNTSLKAQLVKLSVKESQNSKLCHQKFNDFNKQIENLNSILNQTQCNKRMIKSIEQTMYNYGISIIDSISEQKTNIGQKYDGKPICFTVSQQLLCQLQQNGNPTIVPIRKKTYYIDTEGRMLDSDNRYILNDKNQHIRLSSNQLKVLKKKGIVVEKSIQEKKSLTKTLQTSYLR